MEQLLVNSTEPVSPEKQEVLRQLKLNLWSHASASGLSGTNEHNQKTRQHLAEVKKAASKSPLLTSLIRKKDIVVSRLFHKKPRPEAPAPAVA